jgi:hypothetical protein
MPSHTSPGGRASSGPASTESGSVRASPSRRPSTINSAKPNHVVARNTGRGNQADRLRRQAERSKRYDLFGGAIEP